MKILHLLDPFLIVRSSLAISEIWLVTGERIKKSFLRTNEFSRIYLATFIKGSFFCFIIFFFVLVSSPVNSLISTHSRVDSKHRGTIEPSCFSKFRLFKYIMHCQKEKGKYTTHCQKDKDKLGALPQFVSQNHKFELELPVWGVLDSGNSQENRVTCVLISGQSETLLNDISC